MRELPESLVLLYNLQTLKLGKRVEDLPKNLSKLVNLRHLEFFVDLDAPKQLPPRLGQLIQLQTLSKFTVGYEKGCKIDQELGPLKKLKGKLTLLRLERVQSKKEAMAAKLVEKENISGIHFQWGWRCRREGKNYNDLDVLEGLQPHKNLQILSIGGFAGEILPNGIFVENLVEIYLHGFGSRFETLPMLGQLSKLEVLEISGLTDVKSMGDEFYGNNYGDNGTSFPKLKTLGIRQMYSLQHWEEIGGGRASTSNNFTSFPVLESLCIIGCRKMKNTPSIIQASPKLRSLLICECGELRNLPKGIEFCSSLENMCMYRCPNLNFPSNDLQNMHNLCFLGMSHLSELPKGLATIPNLKILCVHKRLQSYDWSPVVHLHSLQHLFFEIGTFWLRQLLKRFIISPSTTWDSDTNCSTSVTPKIEALRKSALTSKQLANLATLKSLPVCECSQIRLRRSLQARQSFPSTLP